MPKSHMEEWTEVNPEVLKLTEEQRETLYQELKRSGQVELPAKYTETHLTGGDAHRVK